MPLQFSLEHIGLPARDTTALKDWYVRVLDAEAIWSSVKTPPTWFVRLPGGTLLELYPGQRGVPDTADNSVCGFRHLALRVENIEAARRTLETRGVMFAESVKPAGGGGSVLFFPDGEGNLLHLVERPADSVFAKA
jgi:glyoxylase I family protein